MVTVVSEPEEKIYQVSFHKRRRQENFDSVPFGYIEDEQSGSTSQCVMNTFKHPFTCMICGPTGCGKTSFFVRLIANINRLCTVPDFHDTVWCFSDDSAIPREQLASAGRRINYHRSIPDFENTSNGARVVVLGDLLNEAYSREVCDLFTKGSHHRYISVK